MYFIRQISCHSSKYSTLHSTTKSSTPRLSWVAITSKFFKPCFHGTSNSATHKSYRWREWGKRGKGAIKSKCLWLHDPILSFLFFGKEISAKIFLKELYHLLSKYHTTYPPCSHACFHVAQIHFGTGKHSFLLCWCTHAGSHHCPLNTHPCLRNTQQG